MSIYRLVKWFLLMVVIGVGIFILNSFNKESYSSKELLIHCGSSMMPAIEEIAKEYEKEYKVKVIFNTGGSETLLPNILLTKKGDIFVCHDPFSDIITEKGLMKEYETTGYLYPVIITAKGNSKGIYTINDLARQGIRVGMTDARTSQCGKIVEEVLEKKGIKEAVKKNVVVEAKAHYDIANALALGQIDAGVVWNFIAKINENQVDAVTGASPSITQASGQLQNYSLDSETVFQEDYPQTRVTVCILNCAKNHKGAKDFLNLCVSDFGKSVFYKHGYTK